MFSATVTCKLDNNFEIFELYNGLHRVDLGESFPFHRVVVTTKLAVDFSKIGFDTAEIYRRRRRERALQIVPAQGNTIPQVF